LWTEWSVEVRVLSGALAKAPQCGAFFLPRSRARRHNVLVPAGVFTRAP
jgi:hypothetical protein